MGDGGVAQALLADEGQIAVVGIAAGGGPGPFNGLGIGRNVDIEIFQPEVISAAGIGEGADRKSTRLNSSPYCPPLTLPDALPIPWRMPERPPAGRTRFRSPV